MGARPFDARVRDLARYLREWEQAPRCPDGVPTRELPADCMESAADADALQAKLREWGHPALVIPHETAAGGEAPAEADFAEPLANATLIELYSGRGSGEEYRAWRPVLAMPDGRLSCPAPSPDYTPLCWRAGEIIRERCVTRGGAGNECATRAEQARRHYVAAPELAGRAHRAARSPSRTGATPASAATASCPRWQHRPLGSLQYLLARGLRFGFIGLERRRTPRGRAPATRSSRAA